MKKVLSFILAVVLVCSMATMAFAVAPVKECPDCGFTETVAGTYDAHIIAGGCGRCSFCSNGFETAKLLEDHEYICTKNSVVCDYCGETYSSQAAHDAKLADCKAKYFNIPLAKIIATVKDIIAKIDFSKVVGTAKDLIGKIDFNKVVGTAKDLIGKISK